jgi:TIR domain
MDSIRNMLFVSHAAPEDNEFARWFALQLGKEGFPVWCDQTKLLGGEPFWEEIEHAIRIRTRRFLFVQSRNSNQRDGALDELALAKTVGKQLATIAAAERGNPGIYLIANDQPLAVREWLPAFARWLNAPPPPRVSVEDALKRDGGADAVYYGTKMRGVSNAKAKRELNFRPRPLEWIVD